MHEQCLGLPRANSGIERTPIDAVELQPGVYGSSDARRRPVALRSDLTQMLTPHAEVTHLMRARDSSMEGLGIFDNDILVVDDVVKPRQSSSQDPSCRSIRAEPSHHPAPPKTPK